MKNKFNQVTAVLAGAAILGAAEKGNAAITLKTIETFSNTTIYGGTPLDTATYDANINQFVLATSVSPGNGKGDVIAVNPTTGGVQVIAPLTNPSSGTTTGYNFYGALAVGSDGTLYGNAETSGGSSNNHVGIFDTFTPHSQTSLIFTTASYALNTNPTTGATGGNPYGTPVVLPGAGNGGNDEVLFTTSTYASGGYGGVSAFNSVGNFNKVTVAAAVSSTGSASGGPMAGLTADGNLYIGTTANPGSGGTSTIFTYNNATPAISTVATLPTSLSAVSGLAVTASGNAYGLAINNTGNGTGELFKYTPGNSTPTDVLTLSGLSASTTILGTPIIDNGGRIFFTAGTNLYEAEPNSVAQVVATLQGLSNGLTVVNNQLYDTEQTSTSGTSNGGIYELDGTDFNAPVVAPEPTSLLLLGSAVVGGLLVRRRAHPAPGL